jgi:hypothetical protein
MSIDVENFPCCCTARVLVDFGESEVSEGGAFRVSKNDMKEEIQREINYYKKQGIAFLSATTNNEQKTANKVLKELGFKCTKWMSKNIHPETKVRLWWLPLK